MRSLHCHEEKAVELILERHSEYGYSLPGTVEDACFFGPDSWKKPVNVNCPFVAYFCPDTEKTRRKSVGCQICVPLTFGSELFLAQDTQTKQLVSLEFFGTSPDDALHLAPYVDLIAEFQKSVDPSEKWSSILIDDLKALYSNPKKLQYKQCQKLKHVRILVFEKAICFFLSTSELLYTNQAKELLLQDNEKEKVQQLCLQEDYALEGWIKNDIKMPEEKWILIPPRT